MAKLKSIEMFVRVAELGSFSAAAREKGIARSIVTRHIAQLEQALGVKLMARSTRRLTLTSAGNAYLEKCRKILADYPAPELDVYVMLPSTRQIPYRVRVLIDFLASRLSLDARGQPTS